MNVYCDTTSFLSSCTVTRYLLPKVTKGQQGDKPARAPFCQLRTARGLRPQNNQKEKKLEVGRLCYTAGGDAVQGPFGNTEIRLFRLLSGFNYCWKQLGLLSNDMPLPHSTPKQCTLKTCSSRITVLIYIEARTYHKKDTVGLQLAMESAYVMARFLVHLSVGACCQPAANGTVANSECCRIVNRYRAQLFPGNTSISL